MCNTCVGIYNFQSMFRQINLFDPNTTSGINQVWKIKIKITDLLQIRSSIGCGFRRKACSYNSHSGAACPLWCHRHMTHVLQSGMCPYPPGGDGAQVLKPRASEMVTFEIAL